MKITVLGAGTWGTALAALLTKNAHTTTLWSAIGEEIDLLSATRAHKNLPGATLPAELLYEKDGGHGMIFTDFNGQTYFVFHSPNETPREHPFIKKIDLNNLFQDNT